MSTDIQANLATVQIIGHVQRSQFAVGTEPDPPEYSNNACFLILEWMTSVSSTRLFQCNPKPIYCVRNAL
jgi:hypothetical protein